MTAPTKPTPYIHVTSTVNTEQHTLVFHLNGVGIKLDKERKAVIYAILRRWTSTHSLLADAYSSPVWQDANQGVNLVVSYLPDVVDEEDHASLVEDFLSDLRRRRFEIKTSDQE